MKSSLKKYREASGLTQKAVSEKLGYSTPQFVSNWERGVSYIPRDTLKRVSSIYKIDTDSLAKEIVSDKVAQLKKMYGLK
jgi:transcriptional regulator with XRE-family HTH domain